MCCGFHRSSKTYDATSMTSMNQSHSRSNSTRAQNAQSTQSTRPPAQVPRFFSRYSTPAVPDSAWASQDFMLGAGMVIIQPSSGKIVLLYETKLDFWFLPKGRKDLGESLEQTALREAYEESGYRVDFLPLYTPSHAPSPPNSLPGTRFLPNTEPIFISTHAWRPRKRRGFVDNGGEYLTSWYVGQIPEDAVREESTGMPNELHYSSHLVSIEEALERLFPPEIWVVDYAWQTWKTSLAIEERKAQQRLEALNSDLLVPAQM